MDTSKEVSQSKGGTEPVVLPAETTVKPMGAHFFCANLSHQAHSWKDCFPKEDFLGSMAHILLQPMARIGRGEGYCSQQPFSIILSVSHTSLQSVAGGGR